MIGDQAGNIDGWAIITARTSLRQNDGGKTLRMFFDALKTMDLKELLEKEVHWSAVSEENWKIDPNEWKRKYRMTY
jgi:hypothetical protein